MDGGWQSSGTDPVAGQMDQLAQPVLQTDINIVNIQDFIWQNMCIIVKNKQKTCHIRAKTLNDVL